MAQVFFECFDVPALCMQHQAIPALLASGRITGLVVTCGDGVTEAVPVFESYALPHAVARAHNVTGRALSEHMSRLLLSQHACHLYTSAEREIARDIKERLCYVAADYDTECARTTSPAAAAAAACNAQYEMPDGAAITVGPARFQCPEALFQPGLLDACEPGVAELAFRALMHCDRADRLTMSSNVVLAGGSTLFPGFVERFTRELAALAPSAEAAALRVEAPQERKFSVWIGGSLFASLPAVFAPACVTRQEWEEDGSRVVYSRCYF